MSGDLIDVVGKSPLFTKNLEIFLFTAKWYEASNRGLADRDGVNFASDQVAGTKFEGTDEKKKRIKNFEDMYKVLTKWRK